MVLNIERKSMDTPLVRFIHHPYSCFPLIPFFHFILLNADSAKPFTFANAGAQVFGAASRQDNDNETEDQEYDPHYEPIISLPENVDIKTGDEDEDVMFRERAKLYRFDRNTNAWKERGVGEMKILKNPETGRTRILMRREQVLKVRRNQQYV